MNYRHLLTLFLLLPWLLGPAPARPDPLDEAMQAQLGIQRRMQESQRRIERLDDEHSELLQEYREVTAELDRLRGYNDRLQRDIAAQEEELTAIERQLAEVEVTRRDIGPLMERMLSVLQEFVALDLPFLPEEREARLAQLEAMLGRAGEDASLPEKFRRLLEAYLVELEYGRSLEAYQGSLTGDDGTQAVDFLRLGRVALYYLSLDRSRAGWWDASAGAWKRLPEEAIAGLERALRVARKQRPPEMLELYLPGPDGGRS
jgi:uncharacterized protein (UPF0335 family)